MRRCGAATATATVTITIEAKVIDAKFPACDLSGLKHAKVLEFEYSEVRMHHRDTVLLVRYFLSEWHAAPT